MKWGEIKVTLELRGVLISGMVKYTNEEMSL